MIINRSGVTIRTKVEQIRLAGRATQGVKIITLREGAVIGSVMAVAVSEDDDVEAVASGNELGAEGAEQTQQEVAVEPAVTPSDEPSTSAEE